MTEQNNGNNPQEFYIPDYAWSSYTQAPQLSQDDDVDDDTSYQAWLNDDSTKEKTQMTEQNPVTGKKDIMYQVRDALAEHNPDLCIHKIMEKGCDEFGELVNTEFLDDIHFIGAVKMVIIQYGVDQYMWRDDEEPDVVSALVAWVWEAINRDMECKCWECHWYSLGHSKPRQD